MFPPLLKIIFNEPGLIAEHVEAYSHLLSKDAHLWQASVKRQFFLKLIMGSNFFLTLLFAGIALMIWGATNNTHWSLVVVPLVPFVVAIGAAFMLANKDLTRAPFAATKHQLSTDMRMFKEGI